MLPHFFDPMPTRHTLTAREGQNPLAERLPAYYVHLTTSKPSYRLWAPNRGPFFYIRQPITFFRPLLLRLRPAEPLRRKPRRRRDLLLNAIPTSYDPTCVDTTPDGTSSNAILAYWDPVAENALARQSGLYPMITTPMSGSSCYERPT